MQARNRVWWIPVLLGAAGCGDADGPHAIRDHLGSSPGGASAWTGKPAGPRTLGIVGRGALSALTAQGKTTIGTPAGVFPSIQDGDLAPSSSLLLPVDEERELAVVVERVSLDDGYFALKGHVEGPPSGIVMLKGTPQRISGWIAFRAEGFAYRYSTVAGLVVVEEVPFGRICPSCDHPMPRRTTAIGDAATPRILWAPDQVTWRAEEPHIGDYTDVDLLTLESRPSATRVLFMDIGPVLDGSGTPTDFSKEEMWMAWQSVAAAFSPFEVNVTTNAAVYDRTAARDRGKANFTSSNEVAYCYEEVFGTDWDCEIYTGLGAEDSLGYGVGRTAAHEFGHMMGLLDAGSGSTAYFEGSDEHKWYPKMGNYYAGFDQTNSLFQWSKGEYAGANDTEDALETISSTLPYRDDDIPDTRALDITDSTSVSSDTNRGIIERNTDADRFTFEIGASGGEADLTIDRLEYTGGGMLDVQATLQDSSEATLSTSNSTAKRSATITATLTEGTYTLIIEGGAEGTPSNGFSKYGSLGYYGIDGTITGVLTTGTGGDTATGGSTDTGGDTGASGSAGTGGATATGGTDTGATGGLATGGASVTGGTGGETGGALTGGADGVATGGATGGTGGAVAGASGSTVAGAAPASGGTTGGASFISASGGATTRGGASAFGGSTPVSTCQTPLVECGTECVDLASNPGNCGICGVACAAGQTCSAGLCTAAPTEGDSVDPAPGAASTPQKQSGCSCTSVPRDTSAGWLAVGLGWGLVARRRRRPDLRCHGLLPCLARDRMFRLRSSFPRCSGRHAKPLLRPTWPRRRHSCPLK